MMPALKKKKKKESDDDVSIDIGASFDVADSKDEDFELDLDAAKFQGKKGQAGTRRKSAS